MNGYSFPIGWKHCILKRKEGEDMKTYKLTAYEKDGTLFVDESFQAATDEEAKALGQQKVEDLQLEDRTHRLASPLGKLLLFHT